MTDASSSNRGSPLAAYPQALNLPAGTNGKRLKIGSKLRCAIQAMVWDGLPLNEAAQKANLTTAAVRQALSKSHVLQYLKSEKEVLRSSVNTRNITRLAEIRDAADNMPAVNAIKVLEELGEDSGNSGAHQRSAGLVIVIQNTPMQPTAPITIDGATIPASE